MKNLLILCLFLFVGLVSVNAQCSKSASSSSAACCASKKGAATTSNVKEVNMATFASAEEAAKADENIQERICPNSGTKTYYQKNTDENGKVAWDEVSFDNETKQFKKVASASMERTVEEGAKAKAKACCSDKEKKNCCAGKKDSKKCDTKNSSSK